MWDVAKNTLASKNNLGQSITCIQRIQKPTVILRVFMEDGFSTNSRIEMLSNVVCGDPRITVFYLCFVT